MFIIWKSKYAPWAHPHRVPYWTIRLVCWVLGQIPWVKLRNRISKSSLSAPWSFFGSIFVRQTFLLTSAFFIFLIQFKPINTYLEFIRRLLIVAHDPTLIPMQSIFHRYAVHWKKELKSMSVICLKSPKNLPNFFPSPKRCHLGIQPHVILLSHHSVHSSHLIFLLILEYTHLISVLVQESLESSRLRQEYFKKEGMANCVESY